MADYYPLISRAVAALEKNSGENRRAIYERARAALLAQLRGVTPPLDESDITRERLALEESIRKVEAESARRFVEAARQMPASRLRSAELRPRDGSPLAPPRARAPEPGAAEAFERREAEPPPAPPRAYPPSPAPLESPSEPPPFSARRPWPTSPPAEIAEARTPAEDFERPLPPPAPPIEPPRARAAPERRSFFGFGRKAAPDAVAEHARAPQPPALEPDVERVQEEADDRLQFDRTEPRMFEAHAPQEPMFAAPELAEPRTHGDLSEPMLEPPYGADETHTARFRDERAPSTEDEPEYLPPEEPEAEVAPRRSYRDLTKGLAVACLVIFIGGVLLWQWPNMVALYRSWRTPAVETTHETPPATAARPKITDRIEPGGQQQAPGTAAPVPGAQTAATPAQKVVLYEEDPADPNGKRFVGSAIWRTETVTPAPGQPPELAIRADIEVPERKLAMTWSLRRNTDKTLPASHTVEIMFKLPADFPAGGISNVPGILMKQAEQTRGVPLAGLAVKVTPSFYLVGLSNIDTDKERNLQLLKERDWFDIPVVYNNNRRAILAMEKGAPGERVFAEAFKAWKE
jgi:hypothetical protein